MKIFLVNPPSVNDIGYVTTNNPLLGLLYLAAFLEKNGYSDVKIIDADVARLSWQELGNLLVRGAPDIIGITSVTRFLPALIKTAEIIQEKLPNSVIITGGYGSSVEPEKVLKAANRAVNFIVMGEGEETLLELVQRIESGTKNFSNIAGLSFLNEDGGLIITRPRVPIMDLDSIPWPAYHFLYPDFSKYIGIHRPAEDVPTPVATMIASRGCPNRCTFCCSGHSIQRYRNPKDIVAEMEFCKNKLQAKSVHLYDDEFIGLNQKQNEWVEEICDEIIRKNLHKSLVFFALGRCGQSIELATLKKMREANFAWIWWGVESGSQKVLNSIKKGIIVENVIKTFALTKEAGIKSQALIMVGFPGETKADIKLTIDLLKKIKADRVGIHPLTPLPGSEIRKYLEENNLLEPMPDNYKLDMRTNIVHHTHEMTSQEIAKYYKLLLFRFENNYTYWRLIKWGAKSLTTLDGWKKLFKRIKIVINYFLGLLKL